MASIAMLVGGALVNAVAFSGSNYMFSLLRDSGVAEERKRHDRAVEELQAAQADWSKKRTDRLDYINEKLRRQGHAVRTFQDVDAAIKQYNMVVGDKNMIEPFEAQPTLADFYAPSHDQRNREIVFVMAGMGATAALAYGISRI